MKRDLILSMEGDIYLRNNYLYHVYKELVLVNIMLTLPNP